MQSRTKRQIAAIQFMITQYQHTRENKPISSSLYDTTAIVMSTVSGTISNALFKTSKVETYSRESYCQTFYKRADNLSPENIASYLIDIGEAAYNIQKEENEKTIKKMVEKVVTLKEESEFMEFMHGIRQYVLLTTLPPTKQEKKTEIEGDLFAQAILKAQHEWKEKLSAKIESLNKEQKQGGSGVLVKDLNDDLNKLRRQLAYLGYIEHLYNPNDREINFKPKHYTADISFPLPAFPAILQSNFAITIAKRIYLYRTKEKLEIPEDKIIHYLEDQDRRKIMEEDAKKKNTPTPA